MEKRTSPKAPRWLCSAGGSRLFDSAGMEYRHEGDLERIEVDRLLALGALDGVRVECGGGIAEWVNPAEAQRLWLKVERDFRDVNPWRPPVGAPGMRQYDAQLWRADSGRHVIVFINE